MAFLPGKKCASTNATNYITGEQPPYYLHHTKHAREGGIVLCGPRPIRINARRWDVPRFMRWVEWRDRFLGLMPFEVGIVSGV